MVFCMGCFKRFPRDRIRGHMVTHDFEDSISMGMTVEEAIRFCNLSSGEQAQFLLSRHTDADSWREIRESIVP